MLSNIIFLIILFLKLYLNIEILKCSLRHIIYFRKHQSRLLYLTSYTLPSNVIVLISILIIDIKIMIEIIHDLVSTRLYYLVFYRFFEVSISDLHLGTDINGSDIEVFLLCLRSSSMLQFID
jgi:hypothetical protein